MATETIRRWAGVGAMAHARLNPREQSLEAEEFELRRTNRLR